MFKFIKKDQKNALVSYNNNPDINKNGLSIYGYFIRKIDIYSMTIQEFEKIACMVIGCEKFVKACQITPLINELKAMCKAK